MEDKFIKIPAPKFEKGQIVYLKTDIDQLPRMVIEWVYKSVTNTIEYALYQGIVVSYHYDFEITDHKNYTL